VLQAKKLHYQCPVTGLLQFETLQLSKSNLTNFQRLNYILKVTFTIFDWCQLALTV